MLEARDLVAGYEFGLDIVRGASLQVAAGEIVVILGPNGAGKSSLIKAVAGLVPIRGGMVKLGGEDITRLPAHLMVRRGLGFVPQTENVFPLLSVADNLKVAGGVLPRAEISPRIAEMFAMFPDLARQRRLMAGSLSGGQRQMLAVARALMIRPRLLILDEPSAGLSPKFAEMVFQRLADIRSAGLGIVLVEQNARAALAIGDRGLVLVEGRVAHAAPAAKLWDDPLIAELYLGHRRAAS